MEKSINRNAVASIPDISFVPFLVMFPQEGTEFILKRYLAMMLFLVGEDDEAKTVGSPKDRGFMIENALPGSALEIGVTAVNNGGESRCAKLFGYRSRVRR